MKKKLILTALIVVFVIMVLYTTVFITDATRSSSMKEPIFAVNKGITDDETETYRGLGYTVYVKRYTDDERGTYICSVEMKMFGKVISAAIE